MRMFEERSIKLGTCILIYFQALLILSSSHRIKARSSQQLEQQQHPSPSIYGGGELQESLPLSESDPLMSQLLAEGSLNPDSQQEPLPLKNLLLSPETEPEFPLRQQQPQNTFHVVDECVKITLEEGVYHFKSRGGSDQVCGLFFVSDPDKVIILQIDYIDVKCADKGLISVVDGWELNGEVFPSPLDHEKDLSTRFTDLCVDPGRRKQIQRTFTSSQNVALIQYRVPGYGQGFSVRVKHVHNPKPCNILVQDVEGVYKLENFGGVSNCSLTTMFDAKIRILYMSVGEVGVVRGGAGGGSQVKYPASHNRRTIISSPLYHKCEKLGLEDYTQIGGSSGLDTSKMELVDEFCGHQTRPRSGYTTVFCGMTTLRLVSSGKYHNKIVAEIRRADIEDLESANYICDLV